MARVAYSCCGEGRGHSSRTLAITRALQRHGHEVRLFASGQAFPYLNERLPDVHAIPGLLIEYANNRVQIGKTIFGNVRMLAHKRSIVRKLAANIAAFQPDFAITDFEPFLPIVAKQLGIPFISVDHQHVIPHLNLRLPPKLWLEHWITLAIVHLTHQGERENLVTSFFQPATSAPANTHFFPPILREEIREMKATNAGHVVVYQTSPSFGRLPEVLKRLPFQFLIYAFDRTGTEDNLTFKPRGTTSFIHDVASADWVLTNGGYTLISESLHFGKPVFSVPVDKQFEQWINAHYLQELGYGMRCETAQFGEVKLREFIARRAEFQSKMRGQNFFGNDLIVEKILSCLEKYTKPTTHRSERAHLVNAR